MDTMQKSGVARNFLIQGIIMKTIFVNENDQVRKWYIIDAAGKPMGRVAAKAAAIARGKNKVTYTKNQLMGDFVIIINAEKAALTGGKEQKKIYYHHTGFVGGEKHPTDPMKFAVEGMLPGGRLGRKMMDCVKIYAGAEHPHAAQNPQPIEL